MLSKLCKACQNFFSFGELKEYNSFIDIHHPRIADVEASAKQGCRFCALLFCQMANDNIIGLQNSNGTEPKIIASMERHGYPGQRDQLLLKLRYGFCEQSAGRIENPDIIQSYHRIVLVPVEESRIDEEEREIEAATDASSTWKLIHEWNRRCIEQHECARAFSYGGMFVGDHRWDEQRASIMARQLPARLIDIGAEFATNRPRLCKTGEMAENVEYMTLSHCWGKLSIFMLNKTNFEALQDIIPVGELPKTFQDAILITRRMGHKFLWIDSLCILQDDLEDWEREAAKMASIYAFSSLNIAATAATDGRVGCFFDRDVARVQRCRVKALVNGHEKVYDCVDDSWDRDIEQAPLNSRGWVLQEQLLAPRTVHFAASQLYWSCNQTPRANETLPDGLPWYDGFQKEIGAHYFWERLVSLYSNRLLTKEEDKLIAISGLARWQQRLSQDEYFAGLWKKQFVRQLDWKVSREQEHSLVPSRPKIYRAPSWSWASIDGPLTIGYTSLDRKVIHPACTLLDVHMSLAGHDPLGLLEKGSYVRLRGNLGRAKFLLSDDLTAQASTKTSIAVAAFELEGYAMPDVELFDVHNDHYCMPVSIHKRRGGGWHAEGPLLTPTGQKVGQFRRVGHFVLNQGYEVGLRTLLLGKGSRVKKAHYERTDGVDEQGRKRYIFTMI